MSRLFFQVRRVRVFRFLFLVAALAMGVAWAQDVAPATARAATAPIPFRVFRDLPYVPGGGPRQRLDLYLPAHATAPCPLVVYIHGGAWRIGTKAESPAPFLAALGYAAASIDYRLSQDAPWPAQIEDCKAAIRWLRAHSHEYGIDGNHIGVWGASAGGQLATLLGVTGHASDFDTGANLDQSSAVQCVVDMFGPSDFLHYGDPPRDLDAPGNAVAELLGGPVSTHQALARSASPVYFVTREAAPFLIFQGDHDPLVPLQQSEELNAALQKAGVASTLQIVPGGGHGGRGFSTPANRELILDFFERYLKTKG